MINDLIALGLTIAFIAAGAILSGMLGKAITDDGEKKYRWIISTCVFVAAALTAAVIIGQSWSYYS